MDAFHGSAGVWPQTSSSGLEDWKWYCVHALVAAERRVRRSFIIKVTFRRVKVRGMYRWSVGLKGFDFARELVSDPLREKCTRLARPRQTRPSTGRPVDAPEREIECPGFAEDLQALKDDLGHLVDKDEDDDELTTLSSRRPLLPALMHL